MDCVYEKWQNGVVSIKKLFCDTQIFFQENAFENVYWKKMAIMFNILWPQWVKLALHCRWA